MVHGFSFVLDKMDIATESYHGLKGAVLPLKL